jgi:adenine specific DNA methylase Mod
MLHSLLQFTPEEVMQFQVTEIEFDFDGEDDLTPFDKDNITSQYIGDIWEADDEEDLVEEITAASGWCIKSIDYRHILS